MHYYMEEIVNLRATIRSDAGRFIRLTQVEGMADGGHSVFFGIAECGCINAYGPATTVPKYLTSSARTSFPSTTTITYFQVLPVEMSTSLDYLKNTGTVVVSDSGDFESKPISRFHHLSVLF